MGRNPVAKEERSGGSESPYEDGVTLLIEWIAAQATAE